MRLPRIYFDGDLKKGQSIALDRNASQHICKVLRLASGAEIRLFNGKGKSASAILEIASAKSATVKVTDEIHEPSESSLQLHLGLGISKGDRMDYAIQKAVELGITQITPLITERTIVRLDDKRESKKLEHWHGIIISACEQCGRSQLPALNPVTKIIDWLPHRAVCKLVFDPESKQTLSQLEQASDVSILIGPEGGLSESEIAESMSNDFQSVRLGPRILRTETAVVTACSALQVLWGDLA
jgi:16S rRNA (uracil1498-N3)-methyltransferase